MSRLIFNLMKILARKNLFLREKLAITAKRTTREKLLAYLRTESMHQGKRDFFIPLDRQALADYLSVDRSGLSSVIGKLCKEGVLSAQKNHFILH